MSKVCEEETYIFARDNKCDGTSISTLSSNRYRTPKVLDCESSTSASVVGGEEGR